MQPSMSAISTNEWHSTSSQLWRNRLCRHIQQSRHHTRIQCAVPRKSFDNVPRPFMHCLGTRRLFRLYATLLWDSVYALKDVSITTSTDDSLNGGCPCLGKRCRRDKPRFLPEPDLPMTEDANKTFWGMSMSYVLPFQRGHVCQVWRWSPKLVLQINSRGQSLPIHEWINPAALSLQTSPAASHHSSAQTHWHHHLAPLPSHLTASIKAVRLPTQSIV